METKSVENKKKIEKSANDRWSIPHHDQQPVRELHSALIQKSAALGELQRRYDRDRKRLEDELDELEKSLNSRMKFVMSNLHLDPTKNYDVDFDKMEVVEK